MKRRHNFIEYEEKSVLNQKKNKLNIMKEFEVGSNVELPSKKESKVRVICESLDEFFNGFSSNFSSVSNVGKVKSNLKVSNLIAKFEYSDYFGISKEPQNLKSVNSLHPSDIENLEDLINQNISEHKIQTKGKNISEVSENSNNLIMKVSNPSVFTFKGKSTDHSNSLINSNLTLLNKSSNLYSNSNMPSFFPMKKNTNSSILSEELKENKLNSSKVEKLANNVNILNNFNNFNNDLKFNDKLRNTIVNQNIEVFGHNTYEDVNNKISRFPLNRIITHNKLNPVQDDCFSLLYETDQNCVITSPTGSGKTTLFEIAMGRLILQNYNIEETNYMNKNFKIIYIAPIKSLCQEKLLEWKQKFSPSPLELSVIESTGDSDYLNMNQLMSANVVLSTPERWDVITRKWKDYPQFISSIALVMIDEIHLLNETSRGATLEAVITRMKSISSLPQFQNCLFSKFRTIALSATIPNLNELAEFLNVNIKAGMKSFGEEYRPVKVEKIVLGYNNAKNEYMFEKYLNYRVAELIAKYSEQRPSLVFCQTQKGTVVAAQQLLTDIDKLNFPQNILLRNLASGIKDKILAILVKNGIAFTMLPYALKIDN